MSGDLAAFYAARLDEDEALAKEAAEDSGPEWNRSPEGQGGIVVAGGEIVVYDEGRPTESEADHIARHDPARVLREVAAGRAILAAYRASVRSLGEGLSVSDRRLVCHLAAVYSGHPDYRQEWKP